MLRHATMLAAGFVFLLSGASIAQGKPPGSGSGGSATGPFEFVGFTSVTTDGDATQPGMHQLCQDAFGAEFGDDNVRACTTREWILSPTAEVPFGDDAWVIPVQLTGDFIGVSHNCETWTNGVSTGLDGQVIQGTNRASAGRIDTLQCTNSVPVTCCARR